MPSTRGERFEPMLATPASEPPEGPGWAYEIKWDGIRALARGDTEPPAIVARRGEDLTPRYPELTGLTSALAERRAVADGEIVALRADGRPSFQDLQQRIGLRDPITIARRAAQVPVTFIAFDLLALDGEDLRRLPYLERREALASLDLNGPSWRAPAHHLGDGARFFAGVREQGLEGIVAKRTGAPYGGGRSRDWLKLRVRLRQEFVIGGFYPGSDGRGGGLGSVLLGYRDTDGRLVYAGSAGSGLSNAMIAELGAALERIEIDASPFEAGVGPKRPGARFTRPLLVCEVEFSEWTREGTLRQPVFIGIRTDKDPREVTRETPLDQ